MKTFTLNSLVLITIIFSTHAEAQKPGGSAAHHRAPQTGEGGSGGGNGGGGEPRPRSRDEAYGRTTGPTPLAEALELKAKKPEAEVVMCPGRDFGYLVPPTKFATYFDFKVHKGKKATLGTLCKSGVRSALFTELSLFLHGVEDTLDKRPSPHYEPSDQTDAMASSFLALLDATFDAGGVVTVVLSDKQKTMPALRGTILEPSWFDHQSGSIYMAPLTEKTFMARVLDRVIGNYFSHELAHTLVDRVWKKRGLLAVDSVPVRHDNRFGTSAYRGTYGNFWSMHTSETEALIEAIAFAFEPLAVDHPFVNTDYMYQATVGGPKFVEFRLAEPEHFWALQDRSNLLKAPLESEAYVASTLAQLRVVIAPRSHCRADDCFENVENIKLQDPARFQWLLSAAISLEKADILNFARALEASAERYGQPKGFAKAWLLEYYFMDIDTGANLGSSIHDRTVGTEGSFLGFYPDSGTFAEGPYFSPWRSRFKEEAIEIARTENSKRISRSAVRSELAQQRTRMETILDAWNGDEEQLVAAHENLRQRLQTVGIVLDPGTPRFLKFANAVDTEARKAARLMLDPGSIQNILHETRARFVELREDGTPRNVWVEGHPMHIITHLREMRAELASIEALDDIDNPASHDRRVRFAITNRDELHSLEKLVTIMANLYELGNSVDLEGY